MSAKRSKAIDVSARDLAEVDSFSDEVRDLEEEVAAEDPAIAPERSDQSDPQREWIARGLGRPAVELRRVCAGVEAGEDRGAIFYALDLEQGLVAIRQDGLRAYVDRCPLAGAVLEAVLAELGLREVVVPAARTGAGWARVAEGVPPRHGEDARLEVEVDMERRAGRLCEDGSIDFREVNFAPNVRAGQVIARRWPPTPGRAGKDVLGRALAAEDGRDLPLKAGGNVRCERDGKEEKFIAEVAGAAARSIDEIRVTQVLNVQGDISHNTGNLNFDGEICVQGSVMAGFSLKATGDIVIADAIEVGAEVVSRASITVGQGIVGRRTRVVAQGNVRAKFVQEAVVMSGGDILLGNSAYNARLYAGGKVIVTSGVGKCGGSIMGGQTWACKGMDLHLGGAPAGSKTELVAGLARVQAETLDKLSQRIEECNQHIAVILDRFNLSRIDIGQIRNMIAASVGPRRKILARHARQLGEIAQLYQKLLGQRQAMKTQLSAHLLQVSIRVRGTAFPGVELQIGEYRRRIEEEIESPCFHLREGKLVEG